MKKVLIVDDAMFMRATLQKILERNSFEVVGQAENGTKAVALYEKLKPDIVTMDITMPEMDGIQATKKIKEMDSNVKIVIVSAMGQEAYVVDAISSGAKSFIVKPFQEDHVVKTLNSL